MPFQRDDALVTALRMRPENAAVLDAVEATSAHGDLGDLLIRLARSTGGMRVIPMASTEFPALVATPADQDLVVAAASGMRRLLIRTEHEPPGARLGRDRNPDLGGDWWRVDPFDPAVSREDAAQELQQWFLAASGCT